jgi:anti-anti-sigma factor
MGSLAMGVLMGLYKEFQTRGQRLIFVNLQSNVQQSLSVSHMHKILEIMRDIPTALSAVSGA